MNRPAQIGQDRYDASLRAMLPYSEPDDVRQLRRRLMTSRDLASRVLCSTDHSDQSRALAGVINDVASAMCFRRTSVLKLREAADLCVRLLQASAALHRLESPDATH